MDPDFQRRIFLFQHGYIPASYVSLLVNMEVQVLQVHLHQTKHRCWGIGFDYNRKRHIISSLNFWNVESCMNDCVYIYVVCKQLYIIYCIILSSIFLANMTYSRSILRDFDMPKVDASGWWRSSCDQVMDVSLKPSTWPFPETKRNSSPLENKHIPKRTFHQRTTRFSRAKLLAVRFRERVV